jgi:hypothetical protein
MIKAIIDQMQWKHAIVTILIDGHKTRDEIHRALLSLPDRHNGTVQMLLSGSKLSCAETQIDGCLSWLVAHGDLFCPFEGTYEITSSQHREAMRQTLSDPRWQARRP